MKKKYIFISFLLVTACEPTFEENLNPSIIGFWILQAQNSLENNLDYYPLTWDIQDENSLIEKGCTETQCWQYQLRWELAQDTLNIFRFDYLIKSGVVILGNDVLQISWNDLNKSIFLRTDNFE
ncbi:MAG: hypothetical protein HOD97_08510 [Candidatus Marinimicrobia bacterium]|jgi:hypothetical protein|nr:hypothetical protein [Candidatus Neomarinimicrobiota bacterium]MBT3618238.1 hypothetical protein [Candidatus Neomarinimicrobiota bacterium]MBT3829564.1 hypothetical protein [Candidatus Neomarinimicrobiota bacterium]MBT3997447.1 hypothetical protein [Candidatus Neomarinimicrobiota bacterium]MBT4281637.1 hypothetical protein [Candidatus Neomarinimicrobiota bacterium]